MKELLQETSSHEYRREATLPIFFFNVAELHEKLKINFYDVLLVTTYEQESRNKIIWLRDEAREYTLMNVSLSFLLENAANLVKANKFTLISVEAVRSYRYDFITLKNLFPGWNNKQVTLARNYRKEFYRRIGEKRN